VRQTVDPVPLEWARSASSGIHSEPAAGKHWVALDIEYFNRTDAPVDRSLAYGGVGMLTSDRRQASGVKILTAEDKLPDIPSLIPPRSSVRGWATFELPNGVHPAQLLLYRAVGDEPLVVDL